MLKRTAVDLLQELEQKTAELEELKQRVHAANGGVKRARSGANNRLLIVFQQHDNSTRLFYLHNSLKISPFMSSGSFRRS